MDTLNLRKETRNRSQGALITDLIHLRSLVVESTHFLLTLPHYLLSRLHFLFSRPCSMSLSDCALLSNASVSSIGDSHYVTNISADPDYVRVFY